MVQFEEHIFQMCGSTYKQTCPLLSSGTAYLFWNVDLETWVLSFMRFVSPQWPSYKAIYQGYQPQLPIYSIRPFIGCVFIMPHVFLPQFFLSRIDQTWTASANRWLQQLTSRDDGHNAETWGQPTANCGGVLGVSTWWTSDLVINSFKCGYNHHKWPQIYGFHWGYFTLLKG